MRFLTQRVLRPLVLLLTLWSVSAITPATVTVVTTTVITTTLVVSLPGSVEAANRYWVGGGSSANWNATGNTNWGTASNTRDNASVPGPGDDVFFDGSAFGNTPSTISAAITIQSLDMNYPGAPSAYSNTLTHNTSIVLTVAGNGGVFRLAGTLVTNGGAAISFTGTSGTMLFTSAGLSPRGVSQDGVGGTLQLQDNLTLVAGTVLNLAGGTLDINNKTVSALCGIAANSNVKVLTLGSGSWTGTMNNLSTGNFTVTANTATYTALTNFAGGNANFNGMTLLLTPTNTRAITGSFTVKDLTIAPAASRTLTFEAGSTITVTNRFTVTGTASIQVTLNSSSNGSTYTIAPALAATAVYATVRDAVMSLLPAYCSVGCVNTSGNVGWVFNHKLGLLGVGQDE